MDGVDALLTLKALDKTVADDILLFFIIIFGENKTLYFV